LTARIFIWHCTFLVNSLAHWDGLQPYSDENTSRGNFILAVLTAGEGNHNFHHAFPHDFRSGPSWLDWDPSKWIILGLHKLGFVYSLRTAREVDIEDAREYMHEKDHHHMHDKEGEADGAEWTGEVWSREDMERYVEEKPERCVLVLDGFLVDATAYMKEHPGGSQLLREYSIRQRKPDTDERWRDASWAFDGGLNNHSRAAKKRLAELRIARLT